MAPRIASTSGVGELLQIDVLRLDGSGRSTLTRDGNNTLPAWSADGRILFASDRDGTRSVYVMEDDGTLQHRVEDRGEEAGWWPGGHARFSERPQWERQDHLRDDAGRNDANARDGSRNLR